MEYLRKKWSGKKASAPTLERKHHKYFLRFSYTEEVTLSKTAVKQQVICSVDLGINTDAVCSIMRADGTILGRHFCKLPKEIDSLSHSINRIKKAQQYGNSRTPRLWARTKGINHDISVKTVQFIMDVAVLYNADVIVFEHGTNDVHTYGDIFINEYKKALQMAHKAHPKAKVMVIIPLHRSMQTRSGKRRLHIRNGVL